jgi:hypothetical protein
MSQKAIAALSQMLRGHVNLGKSRRETLCMLVMGMIGARTVNLGHIATEAGRSVLIASTYRRLQRFVQHVDLGTGRRRWWRRWSAEPAPGRSRSTGPIGRSDPAT